MGLGGSPPRFITTYEPRVEIWEKEAIPKLEVFLKDSVTKTKVKEIIENYDVVTFFEKHHIKDNQWLKSQFFKLLKDLEKEILEMKK